MKERDEQAAENSMLKVPEGMYGLQPVHTENKTMGFQTCPN
jgi:hypothetical protein